MKSKFSIILPTYNRSTFLPKALESVINQTYTNWELIIIDDGSTDNTKEIVEAFLKENNKIRYIYQENAERSAARNNGISNAKGNYICFLDSDDYYHESHLQNFVDLIKKHKESEALYFSGVSLNNFNKTEFKYNESYKTNQEFFFLNTIGTPRACISKSLLNKEKFNKKIRIGEDRELWLRLVNLAPIYYHRINSFIEVEHQNRSVLGCSCYDHLKTLNIIFSYKHVKENVSTQIKKRVLSNAFFNIAKYEIENKNRTSAVNYLLKSLFSDLANSQTKLRLNALIKLVIGKKLSQIKAIIK